MKQDKKGIVTKSTGSWYEVSCADGSRLRCRLRGVFRIDEKRDKDSNPVAVGDRVTVTTEQSPEEYLISHIEDRQNYIVRSSPKHKGARQVIASNLDQAVLVVTITQPRTSTGFIDRFLLTAEAYHIPVVIVFNKADLYKGKHEKRADEWIKSYEETGYSVLVTSVKTGAGTAAFKDLLHNRCSLIAGHSGVGKSSLINYIEPGLELRTGELSVVHEKGMHTTTFAEMHFLQGGGSIIDTPGIKEFGITDFDPREIGHYFIEFRKWLQECRFHNCTHDREPDCAVRAAVERGEIWVERYINYLNILTDYQENFKHWE